MNIELRFRHIVCDQLGLPEEEVKNDSAFIRDLGADSLDIVELIMAAEEEFELEILDEEAESISTFGQAVEFLKNKHSVTHG